MDRYAETKAIVNDMASVKMAMNSHKGNIEDTHPSAIIEMMREEVKELAEAVQGDDIMDILQEVADVQNFLIAIAHQQICLYRNRNNG